MCQSTSVACNINDIATFLFRRHVRITTRSKSVHLFVNVEFDFVEIFVLITPLFFSRCRITSKRFWTNGTRSTTKSGPSSSSWNETDAWPKPMPAPFPSKSTAAMTDSTDFGTEFTLMSLPAVCGVSYMVTHWAQWARVVTRGSESDLALLHKDVIHRARRRHLKRLIQSWRE